MDEWGCIHYIGANSWVEEWAVLMMGLGRLGRVRCPLLHLFGFVCSLDDGMGRVDVVSGRLGICCS